MRLANASNESCGGSLGTSFAHSCNSVFAPLGAKLGAKRLIRLAEAFGFNEKPRLPGEKPSTIARDLSDDLAVGSAAIGQERDLATAVQMASVGGDDRQPRRADAPADRALRARRAPARRLAQGRRRRCAT